MSDRTQAAEPDIVQKSVPAAGPRVAPRTDVALLTGGFDKPYAYGLATDLIRKAVPFDIIAGDELDLPEFRGNPNVKFFNLRGDQNPKSGMATKVSRVLAYYFKLIRYALGSKRKIFHILWNNKFDTFDRTILTLFYLALGKRIVLTVHNVNAGTRDATDSALNRFTLKIQYRLAHHMFVHTEKMKSELIEQFAVDAERITVIPFGINNSVPNTSLSSREARQKLGLEQNEKVVLFFGNITPYKGVEYLIQALANIPDQYQRYRLIVAGRIKNCQEYWEPLGQAIEKDVQAGRIVLRTDFIPDEETEIYFKAADVLALPYRHVYQSGVLFLGYSFGLPVLAADVGPLKEEVVEGETGFVFAPEDSSVLADTIERYFRSDLFLELDRRRSRIRDFAAKRNSWSTVGEMTLGVYDRLLHRNRPEHVSGS